LITIHKTNCNHHLLFFGYWREKADRPFRCLDRPYRRELLRVYMTNIEQIYRRFVEERRRKLIRLIEDKMRWSRSDNGPLNVVLQ
jgi:hypothetical protein